MSVTIGNVLGGKYRILRLIGDGGMGFVFEAKHEKLGTRVAIKVIHPEVAQRPGIVERFLQEARVSAQIRSPHVAQVIDVDQASDGEAYMVMELLEGQTLLAVLDREKKLPLTIAAEYTKQILEGLEAAHALGVVHRDLKPENVFVTVAHGKPVLKLIDFGIAKVKKDSAEDTSANLTMAGITMGTAEYMAPEQAFSADRVDARADIYAVGVIFYEMLSGQRPVMGLDARLLAVKVQQGEVTPLIHAAPDVPPPIAGLIHQAMGPRPELRFPSATEMRLALERTLASGSVRVHVDASGTAGELARTARTAPLPIVPAKAAPAAAPVQAATPAREPALQAPADPGIVAGPRTLRGEPVDPVAFAPATATAMGGPPPARSPDAGPAYPGPAHGGPPGGGRRAKKRGGSGIWLIVAGIVIASGIVTAIVLSMNSSTTAAEPIATTTSTPTIALVSDAAAASTGTDAVQPLLTLGTNKVPPGPVPTGTGATPIPTTLPDGAALPRVDAGVPAPIDAGGGGFHFPFPPPPDGGFVITIPSGLPTIPTSFPGFPPPPTQ